jgi:hypothetical protein
MNFSATQSAECPVAAIWHIFSPPLTRSADHERHRSRQGRTVDCRDGAPSGDPAVCCGTGDQRKHCLAAEQHDDYWHLGMGPAYLAPNPHVLTIEDQMPFTSAQSAAWQVAKIQREILAAMEEFRPAQREAFLDPDNAWLADGVEGLRNKMQA